MCVVLGALKIRDRIQTIPFRIIYPRPPGPSAPWDLYSGRLFSIFWGPLLLGGGGGVEKFKEGPTVQHCKCDRITFYA